MTFDSFIIESRRAEWRQPEPGCDQAKRLAKVARFQEDDSIRPRIPVAPHHARQHRCHHEEPGTTLYPVLMAAQPRQVLGNFPSSQEFQAVPIRPVMIDTGCETPHARTPQV